MAKETKTRGIGVEEAQRGSRDAILRAAEERFAVAGLEGASMREIAERVGITKAALYYHFKGKEELWLAVCERLASERMAAIRRAAASSPDPVVRLKNVISEIVDRFFENPNLSLLIQRSLLDPDAERSRKVVEMAYSGAFGVFYELSGELGVETDRQLWAIHVAGMCIMPFEARGILPWLPGAGGSVFDPEHLKASIFRILFPEGAASVREG